MSPSSRRLASQLFLAEVRQEIAQESVVGARVDLEAFLPADLLHSRPRLLGFGPKVRVFEHDGKPHPGQGLAPWLAGAPEESRRLGEEPDARLGVILFPF